MKEFYEKRLEVFCDLIGVFSESVVEHGAAVVEGGVDGEGTECVLRVGYVFAQPIHTVVKQFVSGYKFHFFAFIKLFL